MRDGLSLDHPRRKPWKSSSNFVTSSVACSLSRICIPLFRDYDRVLHVRSDEKKKKKKRHRNPSRRRFAKTDQPQISKYVSARILMKTLNTVGSFLKSKMKRENARTLCGNFTLHIFLSKENVSTCKNHRSLCVTAHMYTMKLITYGDGLSYRWFRDWWRTQLPGVTQNRCNAETPLYILRDLVYTKRKLI